MTLSAQSTEKKTALRSNKECLVCQRRRKICDEQRPICHGCQRNGLEYQWPSEETLPKQRRPRRPSVATRSSIAVRDRSDGDGLCHAESPHGSSSASPLHRLQSEVAINKDRMPQDDILASLTSSSDGEPVGSKLYPDSGRRRFDKV